MKHLGDITKINGAEIEPVNVKEVFYVPTRRRVDLTNLEEAIDDAEELRHSACTLR